MSSQSFNTIPDGSIIRLPDSNELAYCSGRYAFIINENLEGNRDWVIPHPFQVVEVVAYTNKIVAHYVKTVLSGELN